MERDKLIQQLDQARGKLKAALEQIDPQTELSPGWTTKDTLAHISAWYEVCVKSLRVLVTGDEPQITVSQGIDAFNDEATAARNNMSFDEVLQELEANRQHFKAIIDEMPAKLLSVEFIYPWGVLGTVSGVVNILAEHEEEHVQEIESK
ncbi:MAG: DinB family protein [Anaerolineales bacterium]|nr:DinB family protein [Chloroflexota bacterium]MBL7163285.1 DinB family protein [Anaerolineales bacterium]